MREVFKPVITRADPGEVFYTITEEDVHKTSIMTTAGAIPVKELMGLIIKGDVGRRIYRVRNDARDSWLWQPESSTQRILREADQEIREQYGERTAQ